MFKKQTNGLKCNLEQTRLSENIKVFHQPSGLVMLDPNKKNWDTSHNCSLGLC